MKDTKEKKGKKEKNKNDRRHRRKDDAAAVHSLANELNWGILAFPNFIDDFVAMVTALEGGEYVNVANISNIKFRSSLTRLMQYLPVSENVNGYFKREPAISVSGSILKLLLDAGAIKQPTQLSNSERLASQQFPLLLRNLMNEFPDIKVAFPVLLAHIMDDNAVQLEDIENEDVREGLEKLFRCLDLSCGADGFSLPTDARKRESVLECLHLVSAAFSNYSRSDKQYSASVDKPTAENSSSSSNKRSNAMKERRVTSSSSSDDSENEDKDAEGVSSSSEGEKEETGRSPHHPVVVTSSNSAGGSSSVRLGPTMPSEAEWSQARHAASSSSSSAHQQHLHSYGGEDEEEEDDDDDAFGPQMYDPNAAPTRGGSKPALSLLEQARLHKIALQPLGFIEQNVAEAELPLNAFQERYGEYVEDGEEAAAQRAAAATVREEWILDPGQNKLISEMNGIGSQNRKFQTGKVAKKAAATMVGIKQQLEEGDGAQSEEALRTVAVLAEYREKRGATLMEQHLEKKKEKDAKSGGSSGGGGTKRKAFDRDEDMLSRPNLDKFQVQRMVDNAKELDSRFDKGSVQKSFL